MPSSDEDHIFDALVLRDTVNHNSSESVSGPYTCKTIFIENGLNQNVTLQLQGARGSTWINIGNTFVVNANTNSFKIDTNYFPKIRVQAICSTAPTTGDLDIWVIKSGG